MPKPYWLFARRVLDIIPVEAPHILANFITSLAEKENYNKTKFMYLKPKDFNLLVKPNA